MEGKRGSLVDYPDDDSAVTDGDLASRDQAEQPDADAHASSLRPRARSPMTKTRSFSDGGGTPSKLSASPHVVEASRRTSKDDSNLHDVQPPVTPRSSDFKALSIQVPTRQFTPPPAASNPYVKPPPLSPQLDHSHIYASPTNILPRRSRGLDFSRAATSLHHSTLAEQSSPDSSPTIGDRAMAIPGRRNHHGGTEQSSTSLWSIMGSHDKVNASSSLGSTPAVGSDTSTSSDDEDIMDEDMDEAYVTTPMAKASASMSHAAPGGPFGSPAMSSLMSFQQRQRPRKHPKKKVRGPLGLGFNLSAASLSKSPPNSSARARRESISWQANQLHISGVETEEGAKSQSDADGGSGDGQRNVTRRPVTRRGNLLPKTKTFARIRAALAEEGAPADTETRREAEVVKQVRESDVGPEPRFPPPAPEPLESADDMPEDDMMGDLASGLSSSFKQHAIKNSRGKTFWDTFSESSSMGGARTTPPPAAFLPRGSSSGISEDTTMDSPSLAGPSGYSGSQRGGTPGPTAAEITRRINNKRRRDDDLDPISFKRRAVSPGMSVHNSPILQSPMQRDSGPWGSRPGSTGGDKGGSSAPSETGSMTSTPANPSVGAGGRLNGKGRVGFQGMIDTNDGIMRMSIE
ncbi:uncharacterized protein HRG_10419 [Hirsutella rhossiliensis]|uniref:Uncharacterized protein n=1 Tax=Hirsutella rhossiliensis TaxID=111463 RepID=A0A9P8MPJ7_9HYPO|nr:uncharacterized protein HRG_10419 [Hirsutella rhossiliensis]KAH0958732.1 hypothetical protein HRG_10419 [Hirsutella rhossiliensis]